MPPSTVPMDYFWAREPKSGSFMTNISDETGLDLLYTPMPIGKHLRRDKSIDGKKVISHWRQLELYSTHHLSIFASLSLTLR
ncbi:ATP-citrate synthase-like [Oncorhynchus keta]|uniref:ATP-citrate synthase-like n=1 Tax=Oncorhynchus keta TaxID=8018 RepID=UPI0015FC241C|nr:ATP-citrate synthase-like [Oncorhynchus keta]